MNIYLSYSREDRTAVQALRTDLENMGHTVWFDDLPGFRGVDGWDAILRQIRSCDLILISVSPEWLESDSCRMQLNYALRLNRPVLPIMTVVTNFGTLPPELAVRQIVDYTQEQRAAAIDLFHALARMSENVPLPEPLPEPPPMPLRPMYDVAASPPPSYAASPPPPAAYLPGPASFRDTAEPPPPPPSPTIESAIPKGTRRWRWIRRHKGETPKEETGGLSGSDTFVVRHGATERDHPIGRATGDVVECTVFSPSRLVPGSSALVQAFAHVLDKASDVERMAKEFDDDATRRGIQTLESRIERGSKITFQLHAPHLDVRDGPQTLTWRGESTGTQFEVEVPFDARIGTVIATLFVTQDSVPLGHIKFKVTIAQSRSPDDWGRPIGDHGCRYSKAFISYASEDRAQVLSRLQMLRPAHIEYFNDLLNLEPGQRWERKLYEEIDRCDLFLLFWSNAARQSEWVRREVDYVLRRKGENEYSPPELWPVIIEGPPIAEPWQELSHLHMNDSLLYVMASSD